MSSDIIKPLIDYRELKGGTLDNGIKYLLIEDNQIITSEIIVVVKCGCVHDKSFYPGLAHFLEHMLFLGSNTYPEENYFFSKLSQHNGKGNAFTTILNTTYYCDFNTKGFEEIIKIFSRFFIDPLLTKDAISREINSVDNEHKMNILNDSRIMENVLYNIIDEKSPLNNFSTGNLETLNKSDIYDKLLEFYKKYYISNNFSIVILSNLSIDVMYTHLINTFGIIKKNNNITTDNIIQPYFNSNLNKRFFIKSYGDKNIMYIAWEIPKFTGISHFVYLQFCLLIESKDGLSFFLKKRGYLNNINIEIEVHGLFIIIMNLTELGFNNLSYVYSILFKYINDLQTNKSIQSSIVYIDSIYDYYFKYIFEYKNILTGLGYNHFYYKINKLIRASVINPFKGDVSELYDLYNKYIKFDNNVIILSSRKETFSYLKSFD